MPNGIYVLIDHSNDSVRNASWETLALGQKLAAESGFNIHAVVLGDQLGKLAGEVASKKVDSVLLLKDPKLSSYDPDCYGAALKQLIAADKPYLLLMAHIYQNIDLAPKLAAATRKGLLTDCIGYRRDNGQLIFIHQMFRNKINADIQIQSEHPWIITVQAGAYSTDHLVPGSAPVEDRKIDLSSVQPRRRTLEAIQANKGKVDLSKAEIVVAVGRGIKKQENLKIVEELAQALGAEIGASRPVVDNEWLARDRQVGSSGQTVAAKLYIACGISGAIQHIVGMKNSSCIVAINKDPNAPIFNIATYGIVGDLFEVVPEITKRLKQ